MYYSVMIDQLVFLARAGGGGSGGSGGSGGADGGLFVIPALFATGAASYVRKRTRSKAVGLSVGVAAGSVAALPYLLGGGFIFFLALASGVAGAIAGALVDKIGRFRGRAQRAQIAVRHAAASDPAWDQEALLSYATSVFRRFQYDWQRMDLSSIQQYTTPEYAKHVGLMLYAMQQMGRVNELSDVTISEALITGAHDAADNSKDRVNVAFVASMRDQLKDRATNTALRVDHEEFGEQWNFVRSERGWLLDGIDQGTEDPTQLMASLRQFARQHAMYYSPDWGRLLLPTRGQLFRKGYTKGDVNNHVIGFWTGKLLVQLYTYVAGDDNNTTRYLVGQVTLPKSYGGILVERKDGWFSGRLFAPRGYAKVQLEWPDFHRRYTVYATDENRVTSFELLNPGFMAWLYDRNLKVNIEVVDNVVYLYAKLRATSQLPREYAEMMEVLRRAHKELER